MSDRQESGVPRRIERVKVGSDPHYDGITRGTVVEYDDWQWAVITEIAEDVEPPKFGFVLVDELGDDITRELEAAWGCWEHYEAVQPYRGSQHEYWADIDYIVNDDIWTTLGPVHPDARTEKPEMRN